MKYPTREGLAIHPHELGYTPTERIRGKTTNHHMYFERKLYADGFRRIFRNLAPHVVPLFIPEHHDLHFSYSAPSIPTDRLMLDTIQDYFDEHGVIECVKEKQTNTTYRIQADEWRYFKGLYVKAA